MQNNTTTKPLNQNNMVLIFAHIGFALWFYVGYKYGKSKSKSQ